MEDTGWATRTCTIYYTILYIILYIILYYISLCNSASKLCVSSNFAVIKIT